MASPGRVTIDDLTVEPYYYDEAPGYGGADQLRLRLRLSAPEWERLRGLLRGGREARYPVVVGADGAPARMMRFGAVRWSADGDAVKVQLTLIDPSTGEPSEPLALHNMVAELGAVRWLVAGAMAAVDDLAALLEAKGVLTPAERASLRRLSTERIEREYIAALRVDD